MPKPQRINPFQQQEIVIASQPVTALAPAPSGGGLSGAPLLYDYSQMDPQTAEQLQRAARRIKSRSQRIGSDLLDIGQYLTEAKDLIPHGQWLPWLDTEFKISAKGAERLMATYEAFKERRDEAALFNPTVLAVMASKSFPEAARQDLIAQAKTTSASPSRSDAEAAAKQHKKRTGSQAQTVIDTGQGAHSGQQENMQNRPATTEQSSNSTLVSNLQNAHTGGAPTQPTESSDNLTQSAPKNPPNLTALPSTPLLPVTSVVEPTRPLYPSSYELQRHLSAWVAEQYSGQPIDERMARVVLAWLQNLRRNVNPTCATFTAYLAQHGVTTFRHDDLLRAINDAEPAYRAISTGQPAPSPRFLSVNESQALILEVITAEADHATDPQELYNTLLRLPSLQAYLPALPVGVTLTNQPFYLAYQQLSAALRQQIEQSTTSIPSADQAADNKPDLTAIYLHPETATILAHALRNRSFGNLRQSIIEEILTALNSS